MKKKLVNNFYDCHVTSTPNENQCKNLYQKCSKNGFNSICGQSLLKLMSNVWHLLNPSILIILLVLSTIKWELQRKQLHSINWRHALLRF